MATVKSLRFKEPEVDDYVIYKYTESESTDDNDNSNENSLEEIKEEEEDGGEEGNLISENEIRNSIELLSHDKRQDENDSDNKKSINDDANSNNVNNENDNTINDKNENNNNNDDNNNNNNVNVNKSNSEINKSYESMGSSFVIYKEGDDNIIEGIPQIEIKLNISRDNLLANNNLGPKKTSAQNIANNIVKYSNTSLNSIGSNIKKESSKNCSSNSQEKLNKNENTKITSTPNEKNLQNKCNISMHSIHSKHGSQNSLLNHAPGQERNTKEKPKIIANRSKERSIESQKKLQERKLMRMKLRTALNEKRNSKVQGEVSINITNLENSENKDNNDGEEQSKVKLAEREKPLTKNTSSTNAGNTNENIESNINSDPYTPRKNTKSSEIIPKKDEDINQILKEIGETHFLIDDRGITLDKILEILDQTEVSTINGTIGDENLDNATHMKNYEHGAIFRLPSENNHILKIIPFDTERDDLDIDYNTDNNQVSLKTVFQEVVATTILSSLHASGDVSLNNLNEDENKNQVSLAIEDDQICNEKKILAFPKPSGIFICKGSTNQAFNYEFQNYQLDGFNQDQYYLVVLYNSTGEIINSVNNTYRSLDQVKSILWQICYSLAIAEESLGFEHRELYPECILVEEVPREELTYPINDREIVKDNFGVKASILDFSRSRLEYKGKVYYSDLTSVIYDDPEKKKSLEDIKAVLDSTWYQSASIVNRASFADLIQSFSWMIECDKGMINWLYNNMLEFAVRVEYNVRSMKDALNDPFWDLTAKNWEMREMKKLSMDYNADSEQECIIL
ncbi:hypothetical protein BCR36DRAFT_319216 [Piromyces finnis]|uniref:Protein kinase domain-containing protein n=1 Tax=Piromyces finnis TaxID=1754191 RepID=A0A1Y1VIA9_9FUNG|nr:hypothetical protein BCR36DRAFT_319216 [Piromyces finnis]|eukprot:ORX57135.1 hypothetical protein BCR36DRAFT_319216 [Piromyces finnis]